MPKQPWRRLKRRKLKNTLWTYLVRAEPHAALAGTIYRLEDFPRFPEALPKLRPHRTGTTSRISSSSQSEYDWAYAKRALARGEPEELVVAAIAMHRRNDKHDPMYYAGLTVKNAKASLNADKDLSRSLADPPLER